MSAPAVDGRATEAVLRLLAEALGVARHQLALVTGATSRSKVVRVSDPPEGTDERIAALLG